MNKLLWMVQGLLAVIFLAHGVLLLAPPADMVAMMDAQLGYGFRIFLGAAEVLAAIGLIAPGVTRILPWLTPLAAVGLMVVMASATVLHAVRFEIGSAITTAVLLLLVSGVAYLRWKVLPITARTTTLAT